MIFYFLSIIIGGKKKNPKLQTFIFLIVDQHFPEHGKLELDN